MKDWLSNQRLQDVNLNPKLVALIHQLDARYIAQFPTDCLRTAQTFRKWEDQEALWHLGRDENGIVVDTSQTPLQGTPGMNSA
jgi:hypothetical protein